MIVIINLIINYSYGNVFLYYRYVFGGYFLFMLYLLSSDMILKF